MTMSRKPGENHKNTFNDVIGIVLILFMALPLLFAQLSFDPKDVSYLTTNANKAPHNWIGLIGAWLGFAGFFLVGGAAYLLPPLLTAFGVSYLLNFFGYLRERLFRSLLWAFLLLVAVSGLLYLADGGGSDGRFHLSKNITSAGGFLGYLTYGQTASWEFGFCMLGKLGATIVYAALGLISLLFLTNFHLGGWIQALMRKENFQPVPAFKTPEEIALEKRAQDLEKQKRALEKEVGKNEKLVEKTASGLGADGQPVPEPMVRDLSVPQAKGLRVRKTTLPEPPKEIAPATDGLEIGEVIHAEEIRPATPAEKMFVPEPVAVEKVEPEKSDAEKSAGPKAEPVITIADNSGSTPRPRPVLKKHKPMTVASVPMIGNYQLPSMDFLQHADMTVKPTESKEELMANARLMQQTLAQFDIEVSLGDITKGPTITRYELHPAPGVKMEKITALSNNIAAALKAERIHILAPVPGKSSVGVEVPNLIKTKVIMRDLFESDEWRNTKADRKSVV